MEKEKLQEILCAHREWVESDGEKGKRANLTGADLYDADLRGAILAYVNLRGANLRDANLWGANLWDAEGIVSIGPMPQSGRMAYFVKHESCIMVQAGCFWGSTDDLKAKAQEEDKPWYATAITHAECVLA